MVYREVEAFIRPNNTTESRSLSQFFHHITQEAVKYNSVCCFFPLLLNYKKKLVNGKQSRERICGLAASCVLVLLGSFYFR